MDFFVKRIELSNTGRKPHQVRILVANCGAGNLAMPLAQLGYDVMGADTDEAAIGRARETARDFSLKASFFVGPASMVQGKFDVVILDNLQDETDPASFLEALKEKTAPDGILLVAAERVNGFSRRSLPRLLMATGWRPRYTAVASSWFRQFFGSVGRHFMKRGSKAFHACDAMDNWMAHSTPNALADGWLIEAKPFDPGKSSVVHIVDSLNAGGAERLVLELAKRLPSHDFEIQVLSLLRGGPLEPEYRKSGIKLTVMGYAWPYGLDTLWKTYAFLRRERPQIVHTHLFAADVWGRTAARLARVPIIVSTEHNSNQDFGWIRRVCKKLTNRFAARLIAISQTVKKEMEDREGADPKKIETVPNGIDISRVIERPARHFRDVPRLLTLSRLTKQKDLATLLKALALVKGQWILQVAGTGEEENELKNLARRLGLESRIEFLGYCEDAPVLLAQSDIFCLPSRWEGQGLAVLEAAAAGVPMIVSDLPVLHETVDKGEAVFVESGDVPSWAHAIEQMLAEQEDFVARAQSAKARIRGKYPIEKMVGAYARVYRGLVPSKSGDEKPLVYQVVTSFYPAGAERLVFEIAKRLPEHGYRTKVASINGGGLMEEEFKKAGVEYRIWEKKGPANSAALFRLYREFRETKPLIVHTNLFGADVWGRLAAYFARVPLIITTEHNAYLDHGAIKRCVKRGLVMISDGCVAVSDMVKEYMLAKEHMPAHKITVIKNAVDMQGFGRRVGGLHDPARLINIGRLTRQKDQVTLLKALAETTLPWRLQLVGTGEMKVELEDLTRELGIADKVDFLGHRHDIGRLLAESDLFVSTSRWEGLALTVIEAAATGVPMVLPDIRASHEVAGENEAKFARPGDVRAFRVAIEESLADYPATAERAIDTAVRVRRDFAIERLVNDYAKYYRNLRLLRD